MNLGSGRFAPSRHELAKRGLITMVALALLVGVLWLRTTGVYGGPHHIEAHLRDAGGSLAAGADVKVRGVIVGRVDDIGRGEGAGVRIRIAIDDAQLRRIPADVRARILPATVFGTTFVDLVSPSETTAASGATPSATTASRAAARNGHLRPGAVVPPDDSVGTIELQQALDDIDALVTALGPAELASAIGSAAQALDGRGGQIGDMIDRLAAFLADVNPMMPVVASNARKLAENLVIVQDLAPDMFAAAEDALVVVDTVVTQQAAISAILGGGAALAGQATVFMGDNADDLVGFLRNGGYLLDAVYDHRRVAITDAFATNRRLQEKLDQIITHGFAATIGRMDIGSPGRFYTAADCPRYGAAEGANCRGLTRSGLSSMVSGGGGGR